jgi:hypothetical protein
LAAAFALLFLATSSPQERHDPRGLELPTRRFYVMKLSLLKLHLLRSGTSGLVALGLLSTVARADSADAGPAAGASIPDPQPVPISILQSSPKVAGGLIFVTPAGGGANAIQGAEIVDNLGRPVWFDQLPSGIGATDFRVQQYRGEPVLTWIQSAGQFSTGPTTDYIADRSYHVIATVNAGNGLIADIHEFRLTAEGTALITAYNTIPGDLSSVGGPAAGLITEGVYQEIDIASGRVLFEWHSLDHVPLEESHAPAPTSATTAYDYFHANAINPDVDGNFIVSSRNTWTVFKLDRHTGAVIWRLGGKSSSFALGPNVAFAWQHNPLVAPGDGPNTYRIFDNEASPTVLPYSRVIWVHTDEVNKTTTLERWFKHPDNLSAGSQGNSQALDNGDTFVGWGALGRFSEFDHDGNLLFDAAFPTGYDTYRAYRFDWVGAPDTSPIATVQTSSGGTTVHAIWNGATEVASWDVIGIDDVGDSDHRHALSSAPWNGLDTAITIQEQPKAVSVVARDRFGREIGRSPFTAVTP